MTWEEYPEYLDGPAGPEERARRGRWRLVVATALFATLILPRVLSSADPSVGLPSPNPPPPAPHSAPEQAPGGAQAPSSPTGPPLSGHTTPPPTLPGSGPSGAPGSSLPPADPVVHAFRSIRAGDCLSVHRDGDDGRGWNAASPSAAVRTPCGAPDARVRVTGVRADGGSCPRGNGRDQWSHRSARGVTVLCLTRRFRPGDCLLASALGHQVQADLMSAPPCGIRHLPRPYDRLLTVTGVHYDTPSPVPRGVCAWGADDQRPYWTWRLGSGHTVICARNAWVSGG